MTESNFEHYSWWFGKKLQELNAVYLELFAESDRGVAIIGGTIVDESLNRSIRHRLRECRETDYLLSFAGAVGTTSARISLACALGLIGPNHRDDLVCINKVRNLFAHNALLRNSKHDLVSLDFQYQNVKDLCDNLKLAKSWFAHNPTSDLFTDHKKRFAWTVTAISGNMWNEREGLGKRMRIELPTPELLKD